MKIIEVKNVSKSYFVSENKNFLSYFGFRKNKREIKAINNVSFEIEKGETVGLIGVNGAGKSTMIKLLTGILFPTSGEIKVLGNDPYKNRLKNNYRIAAVFGQRCQLRWYIPIFDSYQLLKKIYKVNDDDFKKRLTKLRNVLKLDEFIYQPVRTLSLGQKMRAELGAAFIHNPEILFLDEPTIGLDIFSKESIINFINEIKNDNRTIILTTHDVFDIKDLCNRIIILDKGKVLIDDYIDNIQKLSKLGNKIVITNSKKHYNIPKILHRFDYKIIENTMIINNMPKDQLPKVLESILSLNDVLELKIESPDFKDVLKEIYYNKQNETQTELSV